MEKLILWHRLAARGRDDASEPGVILGWSRTVRARVVAAGGEILAQISGTVVGAFDPDEASDVLELALGLQEEAEREGVAVVLGIARGDVQDGAGRAVEIAELLATRAQPGELVLDPGARDLVEGLFLFSRQVSTGVGGPRGSAIDREHPRRDELGDAIARLAAPAIAPVTAELADAVAALARGAIAPAIVLRGPVGAGAIELVAESSRRAGARVVIGVGAAPGGVVPLASLRYALSRGLGSDDAIVAACGDDPEGRAAGRTLRAVLRGALPPRDAVVGSLAILLERVGDVTADAAGESRAPARAWAFLSPLALVDAATVEVLDRAREAASLVLVARYPIDARLPGGIGEPLHEVVLPPLHTSDARAVAESVLGAATDPELARRVAVLGGETPLGVLEVARALIATGDLVPVGEGFAWRAAPRGGASAIPLEEVVTERLELLDDGARRVLEAVCVAPEGASRDLVEAIALRDGIVERARARALERLGREAWLAAPRAWPATAALDPASEPPSAPASLRPHPSSNFVRRLVIAAMPPSRVGELHRFTAEALLERGADDAALPSLRAELAHFEIEGGLEARGAERLADVARTAIEQGYRRAAARLANVLARLGSSEAASLSRAAATVPPPAPDDDGEAPPSTEIALDLLETSTGADAPRAPVASGDAPTGHAAAGDDAAAHAEVGDHASAHEAGEPDTIPPPAAEAAPPSGDDRESFVAAAEEAVRTRDLEALDRLLERAVASGSDMAAVARVRAMAELLRGDVGGARRSLAKARSFRRDAGARDPREALAEAAVSLGGGDPAGAVRLSLRALGLARAAADRRGEIAALRTLAACYRALGRDVDATDLDAAGESDAAGT